MRERRRQPVAPASRGARRRRCARAAAACMGLAVLLAGGCGSPRQAGALRAAADAEWTWLQDGKRRLDELRAQLAALPAGDASGAAQAGAAAPERQRLEAQVDALGRELDRRLVAYINADPPIEGEPLSRRQLAAARLRSDEEVEVAHQAIARGGDYRRAIEIYEAALACDPQNERLQQELARARQARFMTAARFAQAAPGMTAEQVRDVLGRPNSHDIRTWPDKGVVGWFYPRDPTAAAAVWFQHRGNQLIAYLCDWNALPPPTASHP